MTYTEWKEHYEKGLYNGIYTIEILKNTYDKLKEVEEEWKNYRDYYSYANSIKALENILGVGKYTAETLKEINARFLGTHYRLSDSDVEMANNYVRLIESTRSNTTPKPGDRIRYTNKHGDYYRNAHIEKIYEEDGDVNICESPYVPFIWKSKDGDGIRCITSGGAWTNIPINKLKYVGQEEKTFCDWGSCGACADGAVEFKANVSVWEYKEPQKYPYTTETHERMYVTYDPSKRRGESRYTFFGTKNGTSGNAWIDEFDFQAWLETFRGKVFKGNWDNQLVVWYWKEIKHSVSPKEFESINAPEDTLMNNCRILRCKRIYDEKNYTVHTYWVWYWDDPTKDWREAAMEQNKIREKYYECPWGITKENELARRKIMTGIVTPIDVISFLKGDK